MTETIEVIAADVGNSTINLATRSYQGTNRHSVRIDGNDWITQVIAWVQKLPFAGTPEWRIASVHPDASNALLLTLKRLDPPVLAKLVTWRDVPMRALVDEPEQLGIDRLLSAYAASRQGSVPMVVVDAGSAVTVDWIGPQGQYHGGAILPGLKMQLRSLASGTAALPQVEWNETKIRHPARNTSEAILSGVLAGIAGGIDKLIHRYQDAAGLNSAAVQVVLTGGDGPAISPHLDHNHEQFSDLVCRALLDLPRSK